jgi:predicted aspartyl protease
MFPAVNVGLTVLRVKVGNPAKPKVTEELEFLVDSGAVYSVVPAPVLRKLGIKPLATQEFRLADRWARSHSKLLVSRWIL